MHTTICVLKPNYKEYISAFYEPHMDIPGFKGLISHLPDYSKKKIIRLILRLPILTIIFVLLQTFFLYLFRDLSTIFSVIAYFEWTISILNNIVFIFFGTLIAQLGFTRKTLLLSSYPKTAYQRIVKTILTGIAMAFSGLLFGYVPFISPATNISQIMNAAIDGYFLSWFWVFRVSFGGFFLILGVWTAIRAVYTFGIDTATMVYVYYPEDAKVVDHDLYSIIRHPMYLSVFLVATGAFIAKFSPYSLIYWLISIFAFLRHIKIEEKELLERFGESYKTYIKDVPAILIHPRNWTKYLRFLIGIN